MPVRARKNTARKIKQIIFIILIALGCVLAFFAVKKISAAAFALNGPNKLSWRLKNVRITGESQNAAYEVSKYVTFNEGDTLTRKDCVNLKNMLASSLRQLESVSVKRKLFSKELIIKIKKHKAIARLIIGGETYYLAPQGIIFPDEDLKENTRLLDVYFESEIKSDFLPQELVKLINDILISKNIDIERVNINTDTKTFSLKIKDTALAQMGAFDNVREKIKTLTNVIEASKGRSLKTPYTINLKYFNDGKVYLKPSV